ncbi:hypothetical protein [Haloferula sp. A504]|uniref:hypothetical protein n=1 Tax=Haloferula sp. A504 TaxID=3373601 RepID=UPI0031C45890|nr:hypothetical protein [Verrucomicrobiaceae bacterium E54]
MKPITSLALLSALSVAANAAVTDPVGYVTESIVSGFNFVGLTVHEATVVAGDLEVVTSSTVTDSDVDFDSTLTSGVTYLLEIDGGLGITEVITSWTGNVLTTETDLSGVVSAGATYSIRPAATLESVFGAAGENIAEGTFGTAGAEQVWLFNGSGYDKYYYDTTSPDGFSATWRQIEPVTQNLADPSSVVLPYAEGFILFAAAARDLVLTGEVKMDATEINVVSGFNFAASSTPVSGTLATAFGVDGSALTAGTFGTAGADQVWLFNGSGYDKYYYDTTSPDGFSATWRQIEPVTQNIADPSAVAIPSGYIIFSAAAGDITQGIPVYAP